VAVPPTLHVIFILDSYSTVPIGCRCHRPRIMLRLAVSHGLWAVVESASECKQGVDSQSVSRELSIVCVESRIV